MHSIAEHMQLKENCIKLLRNHARKITYFPGVRICTLRIWFGYATAFSDMTTVIDAVATTTTSQMALQPRFGSVWYFQVFF